MYKQDYASLIQQFPREGIELKQEAKEKVSGFDGMRRSAEGASTGGIPGGGRGPGRGLGIN